MTRNLTRYEDRFIRKEQLQHVYLHLVANADQQNVKCAIVTHPTPCSYELLSLFYYLKQEKHFSRLLCFIYHFKWSQTRFVDQVFPTF